MRNMKSKNEESIEKWCWWRRIEKIKWSDGIKNKEALRRIDEKYSRRINKNKDESVGPYHDKKGIPIGCH